MRTSRHFAGLLAGVLLAVGIVGCATSNENIPTNAQMVTSGNGVVAFTAPRDGKVYILDKNMNKLLYSANINKGQAVSVDPTRRDRNITIDNNAVTQESLNVGHTYQIYFHPMTDADRNVAIEEHVHHDHDPR